MKGIGLGNFQTNRKVASNASVTGKFVKRISPIREEINH
jgi:hypothetical protein